MGSTRVVIFALACLAMGLGGGTASAQVLLPGVDPGPIPSVSEGGLTQFEGQAVKPDPFAFPATPQHPFMAPNGKSNIHVDAFQTDTNTIPGPLGNTSKDSIYFVHECASITFDSQGRIVSICVGLERPILALLNPDTLVPLATYELPPRQIDPGGNPFTDFSGGGYFYLDDQDRSVMPTAERHVLVIGQTNEPDFEVVEDYDLNGVLASDDKVISALPDWKGRIWFISVDGVVGWISPDSGAIHSKDLGEPIGNSFAVDEKGSVYVVTDAALYRLRAKKGKVREEWRRKYPNIGEMKPGQTQAGSGTTPTLLAGGKLVAITDNADPMNVLAYRRAVHPKGPRRVCKEPLFEAGASATDQSLIGAGRSLIAENNFGYSIAATQGGGTSAPGLMRVKVNKKLNRCRTVWRSEEIAPSVVPKASAKTGLVYTYTKPEGTGDPWYLTALDFRTGETQWKRLAGTGLGFNNNYAPITIGPNGRIYLGVLGGMVAFFLRPIVGDMDLFAGICVSDYGEAVAWYERFFGREATFEAHETECVWDLDEHRSIFILEDKDRAGHATHTIFVDDLEAVVDEIASRGIKPAERETYSNGVRKVTYRDADGNEIGFGGAPLEGSANS